MVVAHIVARDGSLRWIQKMPRTTTIRASKEPNVTRINYAGVVRIPFEKSRRAPEVKHPPRSAAILGKVRPGHVASHQHTVHIMWTDGRIELRAATAGAEHPPLPVARRRQQDRRAGQQSNRYRSRQLS